MKTDFPKNGRPVRNLRNCWEALVLISALAGLGGCQLTGSAHTSQSNQTVQANPSSVDFGQVRVGSARTQSQTLLNSSASAVTITEATVVGPEFSVSGLSLPQTVPAGKTIAFPITFAPSTAASSSGSLLISDTSNSSLNIALSGVGTTSQGSQGQLTVSPSVVDFANVAVRTGQQRTATVSAVGASVTIASAVTTSGPFSLSGLSFPLTIPAGKSYSFVITFKPQAAGPFSANASFVSDASNTPSVLAATGNGIATAHGMFILSPPSNDGNCTGFPANCYSQHLVPTLLCSGNGKPAGYGCTQAGPGEPYVKGAIFYVAWNLMSSADGNYDFSVPDNRAQPWIDAGKLVSFDFIPTSQGSANDVTPSWYLTPLGISSVSQSGGIISLHTASPMGFFPGGVSAAAGLEVQITGTGTALDGDGTASNPGIWKVCDHTTVGCQDPSSQTIFAIGSGTEIAPVSRGTVGNPVYGAANCGSGTLPIAWRPNFMKAWKAFIQQVVAHYASNPNVAYLRFGLGIGGENIPNHGTSVTACQAQMTSYGFTSLPAPWPAPSSLQWTQVSDKWLAYLKVMLQYEYSLRSPNLIATTISPIETSGQDLTTPDTTALDAIQAGMGFGNEGLQKSDPTNYAAGQPCLGGDWCANFVKYRGQVPLELQTLNYSDTTNLNATGSLVNTLPFATSLGARILELYVDDWMCTYDSSWNGNNTYSACTAAGYPAVLRASAAQIN